MATTTIHFPTRRSSSSDVFWPMNGLRPFATRDSEDQWTEGATCLGISLLVTRPWVRWRLRMWARVVRGGREEKMVTRRVVMSVGQENVSEFWILTDGHGRRRRGVDTRCEAKGMRRYRCKRRECRRKPSLIRRTGLAVLLQLASRGRLWSLSGQGKTGETNTEKHSRLIYSSGCTF